MFHSDLASEYAAYATPRDLPPAGVLHFLEESSRHTYVDRLRSEFAAICAARQV